MASAIQDLLEDEITLDPGYIRARVADWKSRVSHLFDEVVSWLPELVSDRSDTVVMDEPVMRKFDVMPEPLPILRLSDRGGQRARFVPAVLWIIGTNGRMNLFSERGLFVIVDRSDDAALPIWEIAPSLRRLSREPLTRSTLRLTSLRSTCLP